MNPSTQERIVTMSIPEPNTGCWLWTSSLDHSGYGEISVSGKKRRAHRIAYEAFVASIPPLLEIDHRCRVRCCVNPDHLEPVTKKENALRGFGVGALHARQNTCKRGHSFADESNVYRAHGRRYCRACQRRRHTKEVRD